MRGGGDCNKIAFPTLQEARQCLPEIEKISGQPHQILMTLGGLGIGRFSKGGMLVRFYWTITLEPDPTCSENKKFDELIGDNFKAAQLCSQQLKEITKENYHPQLLKKRTIFANSYKIGKI